MNAIEKWNADNAQSLLYKYPLNSRSVVFDIGGYEGAWTSDLLAWNRISCEHCGSRVDPHVHIFEPIRDHYKTCVERFEEYPRVNVWNFGLSGTDYEADITVDEAASCLYGPCPWRKDGPKPKEHVIIRDIDKFMQEQRITNVDLISINIEGEEYDLLRRMGPTGIFSRTQFIQVQFHDFMPNAVERREECRTKLAETHKLRFDYPFVWESWEKI